MTRKRLYRRLVVVVGLLFSAIALALSAVLGTVLRPPFPYVDGQVLVPGLRDGVRIDRDFWGVPQVYAKNRADMLFAQGYVQAQDRFWQMEFARRLAQGRLAEVLGVDALASDRLVRNVGIHRVAQRTLDDYMAHAPDVLDDIKAYSAGVNAYISERGQVLSMNLTLLRFQHPWPIEAWTPYDTIAYGVFVSWVFAADWEGAYSATVLARGLSEERLATLLPLAHGPTIVDSPPKTAVSPPRDVVDPQIAALFDKMGESASAPIRFLPGPMPEGNAWAISGQYTASGRPLLANDPHLATTLPSTWYQIGLHSPGFDVIGWSLPGVPGVVVGRNASISWGITNAMVDVQDVYAERLNPADPLEYEVNGEWRSVEVVREVIKVAGAADVALDVHMTRHGPILTEAGLDAHGVFSLQWEGFTGPFRFFQAILALNVATNYEQFRDALRYWDAPAMSFVYADVEGHIAYQLAGHVPVRKVRASAFVVSGWTDEHAWVGWVGFTDLPAVLDPPSGFVVSANNQISPAGFPALSVAVSGDRAQRISDLLVRAIQTHTEVTTSTFALMQDDYYSLLARDFVPLLVGLTSDDSDVQAMIGRLKSWDYRLAPQSTEAGFFSIFLMKLAEAIYHDDLGDVVYQRYRSLHGDALITALHMLSADPTNAWWDDVTTPGVESRDLLLPQVAKEAAVWLRAHAGPTIDDWQWGKIHTITFRALPLGVSGIPSLERLVNRGPYPVGGDATTINNHRWLLGDPADAVVYPSLRFIADMGGDGTEGLNSSGQSGHPTHPNYDDLIPLWLDGSMLKMSLDSREKDTSYQLMLMPSPPQ